MYYGIKSFYIPFFEYFWLLLFLRLCCFKKIDERGGNLFEVICY